jgi:hypothetical protein
MSEPERYPARRGETFPDPAGALPYAELLLPEAPDSQVLALVRSLLESVLMTLQGHPEAPASVRWTLRLVEEMKKENHTRGRTQAICADIPTALGD